MGLGNKMKEINEAIFFLESRLSSAKMWSSKYVDEFANVLMVIRTLKKENKELKARVNRRKIYDKRYRENNPEKVRESRKRCYEKNRERILERKRQKRREMKNEQLSQS